MDKLVSEKITLLHYLLIHTSKIQINLLTFVVTNSIVRGAEMLKTNNSGPTMNRMLLLLIVPQRKGMRMSCALQLCFIYTVKHCYCKFLLELFCDRIWKQEEWTFQSKCEYLNSVVSFPFLVPHIFALLRLIQFCYGTMICWETLLKIVACIVISTHVWIITRARQQLS